MWLVAIVLDNAALYSNYKTQSIKHVCRFLVFKMTKALWNKILCLFILPFLIQMTCQCLKRAFWPSPLFMTESDKDSEKCSLQEKVIFIHQRYPKNYNMELLIDMTLIP